MSAPPNASHGGLLSALDPARNPRAARLAVLAGWAVLSAVSVSAALGRQGGSLRARFTVHQTPDGGPLFVLQNDGRQLWHRAQVWVDDRYFGEHVEIEPGLGWRFGPSDLLDLRAAPLALADSEGRPYYSTLAPTTEGLGRRGPADLSPKHVRVQVGPETINIEVGRTDATP